MAHHVDDTSLGRLLSRREAMALLGMSGAALLTRTSFAASAEAAALSCVVRPQQTEGPYFVDEVLRRSDIRTEPATGQVKPGVPLQLAIVASLVTDGGCKPLAGAHVDLWQCDARGAYSDVVDRSFNTVGRSSCAAISSPTSRARRGSRRSTPAGTGDGRSTSTSGEGYAGPFHVGVHTYQRPGRSR
jgi:hypothetical protein